MKRRRFIFCRDETTSFQQPSNAKKRNLFLISKFQSALQVQGGGGGWGVESHLVTASSDGERWRRPETELLEATTTARLGTTTKVQEKIPDFDQRLE